MELKYIKLFEKFIQETNNLYHSTDIDSLFSMLLQNKLGGISPQEIDGKMVRGISCTSSRDYIYKNSDITIELSDKLKSKYKTRDIDFFKTKFGKERQKKHNLDVNDEKEVFIITGSINDDTFLSPLSKYLVSIRINKKDLTLPSDIIEIIETSYKNIKIYNYKNVDVTKKYIKPNNEIAYDLSDLKFGLDDLY